MNRDYSKYIARPGYQIPAGYDQSRFPKQAATADVVILAFFERKLRVLLIRRKRMPFQDYWAIPGGFVEMDEDLPDAARRELFEETGLRKLKLIEFGAFGHPRRDPRGRTITVAYLALVRNEKVKPRAGDDAAAVGWFPAHKPPELAFDHELVLKSALLKLKELAVLTPSLFELLPQIFSEQDLAQLCAEVFGNKLNPASLYRTLLKAGAIRPKCKSGHVLVRKKFRPGLFLQSLGTATNYRL